MKRSHSKYSKRSRNLKSKGRRPITAQLVTFQDGDLVRIDVDPHFKAGMPHLRFNHRQGIVKAKRGKAYEISINDGNKKKTLLITNVHLRNINEIPTPPKAAAASK